MVDEHDSEAIRAYLRGNPEAARFVDCLISENSGLREELSRLSGLLMRDQQTGLLSGAAFVVDSKEEVGRAIRDKYPLTLIFADVDGLKQVNDTYGHLAGDRFLRLFTDRLASYFKRPGDKVYRPHAGGDEFFIILPETSARGAAFVSEGARKGIERCDFGYSDVRPTASFGVAGYQEGWRIKRWLETADQALCRAKGTQGDPTGSKNEVWVYDPDHNPDQSRYHEGFYSLTEISRRLGPEGMISFARSG